MNGMSVEASSLQVSGTGKESLYTLLMDVFNVTPLYFDLNVATLWTKLVMEPENVGQDAEAQAQKISAALRRVHNPSFSFTPVSVVYHVDEFGVFIYDKGVLIFIKKESLEKGDEWTLVVKFLRSSVLTAKDYGDAIAAKFPVTYFYGSDLLGNESDFDNMLMPALAAIFEDNYSWDDFDGTEVHPGYITDGELLPDVNDDPPDGWLLGLHLKSGGVVNVTEATTEEEINQLELHLMTMMKNKVSVKGE
jgi:hypothetical protein